LKRAFVLGGTGVVGSAVVRALHAEGFAVTFSFFQSEGRAHALAKAIEGRAVRVDLTQASALPAALAAFDGAPPRVAIHSAGTLVGAPLAEISDEQWERSLAINARSAFQLCRGLGPRMAAHGGGDIVIVGGLDRTQSLPVPLAYAASQGTLSALVMAAAKELGPRGIRVNMVALGVLDAGLSRGLPEKVRQDFVTYSALRRYGTPQEAAKIIVWLATQNTFITGKVIAANGGI
jgi:3-oxoacyl-[acyl-carrier protein] reductase